jgi:hypothetical protein
MSSEKSTFDKNTENIEFVRRFTEICGTSQAVDIARLLSISYQTARNYLGGRLPESKVLLLIAAKTPYSVHWLLTGEGKKFVETSLLEDTLPLSDQLQKFVRRECAELIGEIFSVQIEPAESKVVTLTSDKIMEEKVLDKSLLSQENNDK